MAPRRLTVAADELAPVITLLGSSGAQSQSLWTRAIGVDDVQVIDLGCCSIVPQGSWFQSASRRTRIVGSTMLTRLITLPCRADVVGDGDCVGQIGRRTTWLEVKGERVREAAHTVVSPYMMSSPLSAGIYTCSS